MAAQVLFLAVSFTVTCLFFLYGFNCYYLLSARRRYRCPEVSPWGNERPSVSIHLPVYNERYVITRLLDAVSSMASAYGTRRVSVLVLDDSDDDTRAEVDRAVARHRAEGLRVEVMRRSERVGYKAGALQAALARTREDYIAIFDADFTPAPDFLLKALPLLAADSRLGVVQARWDHLNGNYSPLTRALSIGIDVHFLIEQPARYAAGCFLNFNGSCGVIRRAALEEAGGWQSDTLAEDLDVSYRMQLEGWRVLYMRDLVCQGEVPPSMPSFVRQQARWACGSLRTAKKLVPRLFRARKLGVRIRLQGFIHLTYYLVHPLMYTSFLLACVGTLLGVRVLDLAWLRAAGGPGQLLPGLWRGLPIDLLALSIVSCTMAVWLCPFVSVRARGSSIWKSLPSILLLGLIGFGISLSNTMEAGKALLSRRHWEFVRTPKYDIISAADTWRGKRYQARTSLVGLLETASALLGVACVAVAVRASNYGVVPILGVFAAGFAFVATVGFLQSGR